MMRIERLLAAPADLRLEDIESRLDALHDEEREVLRVFGLEVARGLPARSSREELRRIRENLEGLHAAALVLHPEPTSSDRRSADLP